MMNRKGQILRFGIAVLILAIGAGAAWRYFFREKEPEGLHVPLGVEQAAIVTYSGPMLTVAPYKWGVAVNVRIAAIEEQTDRRVYDVRYIANRAGSFDLRDFLLAADGSALEGLPEFRFTGDAALSKDLDTRIEETEELKIQVGGYYYEIMAALGVLWIGWLLLLIFWKRARPAAADDTGPTEMPFGEWLRGFLAALESGAVSAADKAKLEMRLLRLWREELSLPEDVSMIEALGAVSRDAKTAAPLKKFQHWLHHPASPVPREEIAAVLAPYAKDSA
jgi:hypothetical protein